jgi:hypothetical protein
MAVNLDAYLPLVRPHVPGAPNPVMLQALRLAARVFCTKTRLWREIRTVTVAANGFSLAPAYMSVVAVERAQMTVGTDVWELEPKAFADFKIEELTDTGTPEFLTEISPNVFHVLPFPTGGGDVKATVYLAPQAGPLFGDDAGTPKQVLQGSLPDFLFTEHADTIAAGAISYLKAMPSETFSDPQGAQGYAAAFQRGTAEHTGTKSVAGKQRAPIRTVSRFM